MSEQQSVFMVVQEGPGEDPSVAQIPATSGEAALARVPDMAKDVFGEVPARLRTWRIERYLGLGRWTIYACAWESEEGEVPTRLANVPLMVLALLFRNAGVNDGIALGMSETRMLVDLDGAAKQCREEFNDAARKMAKKPMGHTPGVYPSRQRASTEDVPERALPKGTRNREVPKKAKAKAVALEVRRQLNFARVSQAVALAKVQSCIDMLGTEGFTSDALLIAVKALRMIASLPDAQPQTMRGVAKGALKKITISDLGESA